MGDKSFISVPHVRLTRHLSNPFAAHGPYGERQRRVISHEGCRQAAHEISSWPGHSETPLIRLRGLASAIGVRSVWYKDESRRFGLGSFKALGGAYAVARLLSTEVKRRIGASTLTSADLLTGVYREITGSVTVTCATDGNHGRSVAWGAQLFGCNCVIFVHETVSESRKRAIESYGATVITTAGNYDDAIAHAALEAKKNAWVVVSDTSYPGYTDIPRDVMQGYAMMAEEIVQQLPRRPTHTFVQGGVGALASAVCAHFWETWGTQRPRFVVVEPDKADCILQSARSSRRTTVRGDLDTIMAGLACGEVSLLAWDILADGAHDLITVPDSGVRDCMRLLAEGVSGDPPIVAGESAVAGLLGLLATTNEPSVARELDLGSESDVVLIGSEGDTDPDLYRSIIGCGAAQVRDSGMGLRASGAARRSGRL